MKTLKVFVSCENAVAATMSNCTNQEVDRGLFGEERSDRRWEGRSDRDSARYHKHDRLSLRNSTVTLQAITIPPASGQPPKGTIVILHGWGASAQDVMAVASFMNLPAYQLVFPDAPFPYPYAAGGRMWYDFPSHFNFQSTPEFRVGEASPMETRKDLSTSRQQLTDFLKELPMAGGPLSRTILGGFSQGGAMTLDVGLGLPLAGLMVLSGYLHAPIAPPQTAIPPILMVHGRRDTVVPLAAAQRAHHSLQALGVDVRYQEFDMGHEIQPIVLTQVQSFVKELLPDNK